MKRTTRRWPAATWMRALAFAHAIGLGGLCQGAVATSGPGPHANPPPSASGPSPSPIWRFGPERDYPPFVFDGPDGQPSGLSVDLLRAVEPRLGVALQWRPSAPLNEILSDLRAGRVDLVSSVRPTPERNAYMAFTSSYVSVPAVWVTRPDGPPMLPSALEGRRAAVGHGYAVEAFVRSRFPGVRWMPVEDDREGLARLRAGEVDAWVADVGSVRHLMRRENAPDLIVGESVGFVYALSFGYRKDQAEWGQRLDQALRSLDPGQRRAIVERWLDPQAAGYADPVRQRWQRAAGWVLAAVLLASTVLWLTASRRRLRGHAE